MKINEKEVAVNPNSSTANGNGLSEKFKLAYFGSLVIDKRYTSCMLPWIVAEVKRKYQSETLDVVVGNTQVTGTLKETIVEHCLMSISKCIKLEGKEASTFAYLTKDPKDSSACSCHVFEAENTTKAGKFLMTLKKALEERKREIPVKESENVKTDSHLSEPMKREEHTAVQFDVTYIGKLAVSHRKAPPTLIDTSVERFHHHNQQIFITSKVCSIRAEKTESCEDIHEDKERYSYPPVKTLSFDTGEKQDNLHVGDPSSRPRSVSDGTPTGSDYMTGPTSPCVPNNQSTKSERRLSSLSESRNLLMHISTTSVSLSSSLSGKVLMERKVQEISFCQQGTTEAEHFGFICHDAKSSHYHCYVFKAESKKAVDNIMKSLRQAFNSAWLAVGSSAACENCPLHKLHCLCQSLEGGKPCDQEITIRHHLMDNLGETVVEDLRRKYQAEAKRSDVVEQNEIMMSLIRQLYEEMQKVHRHSPNHGQALQMDTTAKEKPANKFIAKAKRSLGDIFGRSRSKTKTDHEGTSSDEADTKVGSSKLVLAPPPRKISVTEMPQAMESITEVKPRAKPKRTHRRSYSDISQIVHGSRKNMNKSSDSREHVSDEETNFVVQNPQSDSNSTSTPKKTVNRKPSYRRAIFDSVVTPSKLAKNAEHLVPSPIAENEPAVYEKKTREQLRALWQKAIMEQRLLIRMEKENSKLRAGEGIAKNKRLKLQYEVLPINNSSNEMWNRLLAGETVVEKSEIVKAIKIGVPKSRRGEIWPFLLKQNLLRNKHGDVSPRNLSYKELREMTSVHQHAILIDCNRTFPAHPYFSQQVGVGQFALYNLLKVYSNLDPELGYCQGLSFVAGLLLMHLGEEEAFNVLRHLNFNYGLRNQYMPDMGGLRVQFYQYSRLLHDSYPSLHDHFEKCEVTPTLYAASWFLTLFASLFPVSFACRVMDLHCFGGLETVFKVAITLVGRFKDKILACESFEATVDFLKVDLPKLAVDDQEAIVEDVLSMEIGDQLLRFEVEYQVFQEEEINPCLIKPLREKAEKLSVENKNLKNRTSFFKSELKQSQRNEKNLLDKIKKLESENERLRVLAIERVRDQMAVSSENIIDYSLVSPIDDNTDSFEHIIEGTDETDDDTDALPCDSPLTIEDSVCDKSDSPNSSPSIDTDQINSTKL